MQSGRSRRLRDGGGIDASDRKSLLLDLENLAPRRSSFFRRFENEMENVSRVLTVCGRGRPRERIHHWIHGCKSCCDPVKDLTARTRVQVLRAAEIIHGQSTGPMMYEELDSSTATCPLVSFTLCYFLMGFSVWFTLFRHESNIRP